MPAATADHKHPLPGTRPHPPSDAPWCDRARPFGPLDRPWQDARLDTPGNVESFASIPQPIQNLPPQLPRQTPLPADAFRSPFPPAESPPPRPWHTGADDAPSMYADAD